MKKWILLLAVAYGSAAAARAEVPACSDSPPANAPELVWGPVHPIEDGHYAPGQADHSEPNNRVWFSLEYLMWWAKGTNQPIPLSDGTAPQPGSKSLPGGLVLLGQEDVPNETQAGGRPTLGYWFDPDQTLGIEASFLFLGNRFIHNADADMVYCLASGDGLRLNVVGGFRYFRMDEKLRLNNVRAGQKPFAGRFINFVEEFETRNQLFGGELGAQAEWCWNRLSVTATAKVGMGTMGETVNLFGQTNVLAPGNPSPIGNITGGLFTTPANIKHYSRQEVGVLPGAGTNVSYHITEHFIGFVGYSFLYVSPVVRPGDQISRVVSLGQTVGSSLTGPVQPPFTFHDTDFWVHGVNFGLEFSF